MTVFSTGSGRTPVDLSEIDTLRSYATKDNLQKGLERLKVDQHFHLKVCLSNGRWTAVFPGSNIQGGYVLLYSSMGFFTVG